MCILFLSARYIKIKKKEKQNNNNNKKTKQPQKQNHMKTGSTAWECLLHYHNELAEELVHTHTHF